MTHDRQRLPAQVGEPTTELTLGSILANGATVVAVKARPVGSDVTVLAIAQAGTEHAEYVTWRVDPVTREAWWGHYFGQHLGNAGADWATR